MRLASCRRVLEQFFSLRRFFTQHDTPAFPQRGRFWRDNPCSPGLHSAALPRQEVGQERPVEISALARRAERSLPVSRTVLPLDASEIGDDVERRELGLARSLDAGVMTLRRLIVLRFARADGNGDRDGRLNGEDIVVLARAAPLAAEVENPDFVAKPPHVLAHSTEGVAVDVARRADEADNARTMSGLMLENLPERPAPEVDVEVVQVMDADTVAGGDGWP